MRTAWRIGMSVALGAGLCCAQGRDLGAMMRERREAVAVSRLKTDDRIAYYQKRLKDKPDSAPDKLGLAAAYVQKMRESTDFGYLERASQLVDQVLKADGANYEAQRQRSEIEMHRHQFPQVAEHAAALTQQRPSDPYNWGLLGDALMERGDYPGAKKAYERMVELRPDLFSYNRIAYYHFVMGDGDQGLTLMSKAVQAGSPSPENTAWCLVEMGDMFFKTGRLTGAAQAYQAALTSFPGYHKAYFGLARLQAAKGQAKEAIESAKKAQAVVPMPEYAALLAELYRETGDQEQVKKQQALVDVTQKMGAAGGEKANRLIATIYADQNRNLDTAYQLAKSEFAVRNDVYSYDALAWVLYRQKKFDEAQRASEKALAFKTPEPLFYLHAGLIAEAMGRKAEAKQHLERWQALNPKYDLALAAQAESLLKQL